MAEVEMTAEGFIEVQRSVMERAWAEGKRAGYDEWYVDDVPNLYVKED